jgi:D-glycero-alpha-D-manno-heptose-7-phosphate kinase
LAGELKKDLVGNDLSRVGEILHRGWLNKVKLASRITNTTINEYYDKARGAGAVGGKILGAGGGGFLLLCCEQENQNKVREALSDLKEVTFEFEPQGSKIIYVSD